MFKPLNPKKYAGNANNIVYRSNLEHRFFKVLDANPDIIMWGSEEFHIPYICPFDPEKKKIRRYFIDLIVKTTKGEVFIIEIKPHSMTMEPKQGKKSKKTLLNEVVNWTMNQAKWKAAEKFADKKGWKFKIFSEKDLMSAKK